MLKVLIADDDDKFRAAVEAGLKDSYEVLAAANGEDGLKLVQQKQPSVILIDVIMPKLSGIEMLRALQSDMDLRSTPCIVMSASHANQATMDMFAQESNCFAFLAKPIQIPDLKKKIEEALASAAK